MNLAQLLEELPYSHFSPAVRPAEIGDALGMTYSHEGTHGLELATSKLGPTVTANGAGDVKDGQPMTNHHDCHFLGKQPLFACQNGYYVATVAIHTKDHTVKRLLAYVHSGMEKTSMATLSMGWSGTGVHWASPLTFRLGGLQA